MHKRDIYIDKIAPFVGKPVVKVITGMRRVGKSCFLKLMIDEFHEQGINKENILYIDKESLDFDFIKNYNDLHDYVKSALSDVKGMKYLFVDEIQEIAGWEKAIAPISSNRSFDVYITGSNAHLLSSDMATLISGRYIDIPIYGLSFAEFLLFRGQKLQTHREEFLTYMWAGGFPAIHHLDLRQEVVYQYISSIYDTILLKDVIRRNNIRNVSLLENITRYLFNNIGNVFTARRVSDYLKSQNVRVGVDTVQNYISHIVPHFRFSKCRGSMSRANGCLNCMKNTIWAISPCGMRSWVTVRAISPAYWKILFFSN